MFRWFWQFLPRLLRGLCFRLFQNRRQNLTCVLLFGLRLNLFHGPLHGLLFRLFHGLLLALLLTLRHTLLDESLLIALRLRVLLQFHLLLPILHRRLRLGLFLPAPFVPAPHGMVRPKRAIANVVDRGFHWQECVRGDQTYVTLKK